VQALGQIIPAAALQQMGTYLLTYAYSIVTG